LAEEQEFDATFPNGEVGAMPPFGNLYGVDVYVDQLLADDKTIVMRAGTHTDTIEASVCGLRAAGTASVGQFGRHT